MSSPIGDHYETVPQVTIRQSSILTSYLQCVMCYDYYPLVPILCLILMYTIPQHIVTLNTTVSKQAHILTVISTVSALTVLELTHN